MIDWDVRNVGPQANSDLEKLGRSFETRTAICGLYQKHVQGVAPTPEHNDSSAATNWRRKRYAFTIHQTAVVVAAVALSGAVQYTKEHLYKYRSSSEYIADVCTQYGFL